MRVSNQPIEHESLQRAALEVLRDIGDVRSIEIIRISRRLNPGMRQFSFQVVEETYWRLIGGLQSETFTAEAFQRARS